MSWAVLIKPLVTKHTPSVYRIRSEDRVDPLWIGEIIDRNEQSVVMAAENELTFNNEYEDFEFQNIETTHPSDLIPDRWRCKIIPISNIREFESKEEAEAWVKKVKVTK